MCHNLLFQVSLQITKKRNIVQHITIIRLIDTGDFLTRPHMSIAIQEKELRFVLFGPKATIIG